LACKITATKIVAKFLVACFGWHEMKCQPNRFEMLVISRAVGRYLW